MPATGVVLPIGRLLGPNNKRDSYGGGGIERLHVLRQAGEGRRASLQNASAAAVGAAGSLAVAVGGGGGGSGVRGEPISDAAFLKQLVVGDHLKLASQPKAVAAAAAASANDENAAIGVGRTRRLGSQPTLLHVVGRSCGGGNASHSHSPSRVSEPRRSLAIAADDVQHKAGRHRASTDDHERRASDTELRHGLLNWPPLIADAASPPLGSSPLVAYGERKRMIQRRSQPSIYAGRVVSMLAATAATTSDVDRDSSASLSAATCSSSYFYSSQPHLHRTAGSSGTLRVASLTPHGDRDATAATRSASATNSPLVGRRRLPPEPSINDAVEAQTRITKFQPRTLRRAPQSDLGLRLQRHQHPNSTPPIGATGSNAEIDALGIDRGSSESTPSREAPMVGVGRARAPKLAKQMKSLSLDCEAPPPFRAAGNLRRLQRQGSNETADGAASAGEPSTRSSVANSPRRVAPATADLQPHAKTHSAYVVIHEYNSPDGNTLFLGDRLNILDNGDPDWLHGFRAGDREERLLTFPATCVSAIIGHEQPMKVIKNVHIAEARLRLYRDQVVFAQPESLLDGRVLVRNERGTKAYCALQNLLLL